jgi:hypothetical protein
MSLEPPAEILELGDRQIVEFHVLKYQLGDMKIKPRYPGAPQEKVVRTLRLWVPPEDKPVGVPYWDITSQTLIAQLVPLLDQAIKEKKKIRIQAFGVAPSKRFTVTVL